MSSPSPRFRADLAAQRGELAGLCYYDVTDRATGTSFRMYEVEYLVAKSLDGRPLDAVASDVVLRLGVDTNASELGAYVDKLRELGFLETGGGLAGAVSAALESAVLEPTSPAKLAARAQARPGTKSPSNESIAVAADAALRSVSQLFRQMEGQGPATPLPPPKGAVPALAPIHFDDEPTRPAAPGTPIPAAAIPPPIPDVTPPLPFDAIEEIEAEAMPEDEFEADTKTPIAPPAELEKLVAKSTQASAALPALTVEAELPDETTKAEMADEAGTPALPATVESTAKVQAMAAPEKKRGTSPLWLAVPLVLGGLAAAIYLPSRHPAAAVLQVRVAPARPETVVRLYPGTAQLHAAPPVKFSFTEAGKLVELLPPGQQVKSGDMLAKVDGYVKLEKALSEIRSREAFYQNELDKAERAGNEAAIKHAQDKVEEKRGMIAAIQSKYGKFVLASTTPGIVGENLAKVGDTVEPGQAVTTVTQVRLRADFTMPAAEAQSLKTGMIARLSREDGRLVDCRVEKVDEEGDQAIARVEVMDTSGVAAGDRVRLVKSRLESVYRLPAQAVVRQAGGPDQVYVVQDGKARQRVVTILDRDGKEVIVGQGIAQGDRVVVNGTVSLRDGAEVSLEP